MRIRRITFALLAALGLLVGTFVGAPTPASSSPADSGVIAGAWIVTVKDGYSSARVSNEHAQRHGAQVSHTYRHALNGYAARMSDTAAARVARDSRVASVQADRVVHMLGKPTSSATTSSTETELTTGVNRVDGEQVKIVGGTETLIGSRKAVDVDVAIIDTGILSTHADLNVVGGYNCSRGTTYEDGNGHGTHVAGTVGALDNGAGVVGVAPGARLWAVRVLDNSGSGSWSSVICGVDWVTANKSTIEVANMSLGGSGSEPSGSTCSTGDALHDAICKSVTNGGVTYVVAAGNSSADSANHVPAAYDEVITVSALADFNGLPGGGAPATCRSDTDDTFANFSNYGVDVDLIAPGVCIKSAWKDGGYNTISGTSMAAPHVAGAAALYKSSNSTALPSEVRTALIEETAKDNWSSSGGNWDNRDDRDLIKEPLLYVKNIQPNVVAPTEDTTGTTPGSEPAPGAIELTATPSTKGTYKVTLAWSGATSVDVDIYRDGTLLIATANDGSHTDNLGKSVTRGTPYTYKVCEAGSQTCSNEASVTF